jgi:hypothetical protein
MAFSKLDGKGIDLSSNVLTSFASTGIDDNAISTAITIDSSQNTTLAGAVTATNAVLEGTADPLLTLRSTDDGPLYIEFARSTDRHAYVGFGGSGDTFKIWNEESGGLIQFGTDNTERIRIDASGNLGIGQTTPFAGAYAADYTTVHIGDGASAPAQSRLLLEGSVNTYGIFTNQGRFGIYDYTADAERVTVNSNGGFGIGTTTAKLRAEINGMLGADSYIVRNANTEPQLHQANGGCSAFVCMQNTTITIASIQAFRLREFELMEPGGTNSYTNAVSVGGDTTPSAATNATFTATAAKIYAANRPVGFVAEGDHESAISLAAAGRYFGFKSTRYQPSTVRVFPINGNVTVNMYINKGINSGSPEYSFTAQAYHVTAQELTNHTGDNSYDVVIEIVGGLAVCTTVGTSGDRMMLKPASRFMVNADSSAPASGTPKTIFSYSDATNVDNSLYYHYDEPVFLSQIGDGSGGDAVNGTPLAMLGDTYIIPHNLNGYSLAAFYGDTTVGVTYWNTAVNPDSWTTHKTHSLSGTFTDPDVLNVGNVDAGGSGELNASERTIIIHADRPFGLKVNDDSSTEYEPFGYLARYAHEHFTNHGY